MRLVVDVSLAVLLTASIMAASSQIEPEGGERALDAIAYGVIVVAGGSLALRRRSPLTSVVIVGGALSVYLARDYVGGPIFVTAWLALYSLASAGNRRRTYAAAVGLAGSLIVVGVVGDTGSPVIHLVFVGWSAAAVLLGDAVHNRRQNLAALQERARNLEQTREAETRRLVTEERLRIARDLHDSVAHSMAAINVQAGVAAHVMDRRPDQAREALVVIKEASRDVLEEMTSLLRLMRDPDQDVERAPVPGLDQLDGLVASSRQAGLEATLHGTPPATVSPPVAIAVYRIVQESLTNAARHAGPGSTVTITIATDADGGLVVEVHDNGAGTGTGMAGAGGGVGITGMRERAESSGGTLVAGPDPAGGFSVRARWATP